MACSRCTGQSRESCATPYVYWAYKAPSTPSPETGEAVPLKIPVKSAFVCVCADGVNVEGFPVMIDHAIEEMIGRSARNSPAVSA